ncbi:MAG: hypothetical protein WCC63_04575, partial [Candidatus Bathyarchaeia archaeon]
YGWANESMSYPNYPYEYDLPAAAAILDTKFPKNTSQPNPFYDKPVFPGSSQYLRNYPADHAKANSVLDPLIICDRSDDTRWTKIAPMIVQNIRTLGIPVTQITGSGNILRPIVMDQMDYHLYTGSWTVGRFPPVTLYGLYHSINAFPGGRNYVTGSPFQNTHPKLDELLYDCNYASYYTAAVTACKLAAGYMTELCVNIPLWSDVSYCVYSNSLLGVVNMQCYGPVNPYTFMNAYKANGSPILIGLVCPPEAMNIVYSSWLYDFSNLDRMNLYGGVDTPPYNLAADQPGFVQDWETTTWDDGGTTKTKVVMSFREDGYFAKPVSGDQGENVQARHYFWNAWLDYQVSDGWFSTGFKDLHHIEIIDPYTFAIYFDTYSYWNTYCCQGPLRPIDTWMAQGPAFIGQNVETFVNPTTPGAISLSRGPIWIDYVEFNSVPLTMFTDYNIVKGDLYIYTALGAGTLEVSYRCIPSSSALRGYTPGNLPWQTIFEGAGMYYCTALTPNIGGSMTLKRNPFYYMVTPPLGEIDFVKKPNGNYKIDIFDLAIAGGAFGSIGTGVPSSNWFPGADLAPRGGVIDILDEVTVAGVNWDVEFDPIEP